MDRTETIRRQIRDLLTGQRLAVLCTHDRGQPYASLVAFAASEDLSQILFATPEATRKYRHMAADPRVALLVDSRTRQEADFRQAAAVTATGKASVQESGIAKEAGRRLVDRHPSLEAFLRDPGTRVMAVQVQRYVLVSRFQQVFELEMKPSG